MLNNKKGDHHALQFRMNVYLLKHLDKCIDHCLDCVRLLIYSIVSSALLIWKQVFGIKHRSLIMFPLETKGKYEGIGFSSPIVISGAELHIIMVIQRKLRCFIPNHYKINSSLRLPLKGTAGQRCWFFP